MGKTFIAVRDVDEETFGKFKALSAENKVKLGVALSLAMRYWIEKKKKNDSRKLRLPRVKPLKWGEGTENTSQNIDELLYGSKK